MHDPIAFSLAVLAILGTPGPTNTLLAASGALVGWRRSLPLIGAEVAGYLIAIGCLHALLGPVLAASPGMTTLLRVAIGAYLLYAAFELWTRREGLRGAPAGVPAGRVFITTLLNPKAIVFAFGVIPFSSANVVPYLLAFAAFVAVAGLSWIAVGRVAGRAMASGQASRAIPRVSALVLTCFAGLIVASGG